MQTCSCPGKIGRRQAAVNFSNPHKHGFANTHMPTTGLPFLSLEVLSGQQQKHMPKRLKYQKGKPSSGDAGSDTSMDLERNSLSSPCPALGYRFKSRMQDWPPEVSCQDPLCESRTIPELWRALEAGSSCGRQAR